MGKAYQPSKDSSLGRKTEICNFFFVLEIARFVLTGPAADEILEFHFGGSWSLLGLPTPDCEAYGPCCCQG